MSRARSLPFGARFVLVLACAALLHCGKDAAGSSQSASTDVGVGGSSGSGAGGAGGAGAGARAVATQSAGRSGTSGSAAPAAAGSHSSAAGGGVAAPRGGSGGSAEPAAAGSASSATAGSAGSGPANAGAPAAGSGSPGARLPAVSSTAEPGPFETMQDLQAGPSGRSGLFHPSELGKDGITHPVLVFGCGGGTTPTTYAELMSEVASHGFVVIAEAIEIGDMGAPLKAAIDWIISEASRDGSELKGKINIGKVALGGHSIGSANGFLIADDPRLTTSIHVAGGSLDMAGSINAPTTGSGGKRLVHPVAYVCSEMDQFGNVEKTMKDYENTTAPAWMTVMTGVDHVGAFREGMPAIIAWLRWHLADETDRRGAFLEPMGEYNTGRYVSMNKNW